jgi:hypothetical protein
MGKFPIFLLSLYYMFHRSENILDSRGNSVVRHYQIDLAGNWVLVGTITSSFNVGAEAFKNGIEKNKKRKRSDF